MTKAFLASGASLLTLFAAGIAHADTLTENLPADTQQVSRVTDIVVTAQRREQSAQDVGVALSVFGGVDLKE